LLLTLLALRFRCGNALLKSKIDAFKKKCKRSNSCAQCPQGRYSDVPANAVGVELSSVGLEQGCKNCPAGKTTAAAGANAGVQCKYALGGSSRTSCGAGKFSAAKASTNPYCTGCPTGRYNEAAYPSLSARRTATCKACPSGYTTKVAAAGSVTDCVAAQPGPSPKPAPSPSTPNTCVDATPAQMTKATNGLVNSCALAKSIGWIAATSSKATLMAKLCCQSVRNAGTITACTTDDASALLALTTRLAQVAKERYCTYPKRTAQSLGPCAAPKDCAAAKASDSGNGCKITAWTSVCEQTCTGAGTDRDSLIKAVWAGLFASGPGNVKSCSAAAAAGGLPQLGKGCTLFKDVCCATCKASTPPPPPPNGQVNCVGKWGTWSICSAKCQSACKHGASCGDGTWTSTFNVLTKAHAGGKACGTKSGDTHTGKCATKCNRRATACVGEYSTWSSCTKTCGGGTKAKTYKITTAAANGGAACQQANAYVNSQTCNTQACATTAAASACTTISCGTNGKCDGGRCMCYGGFHGKYCENRPGTALAASAAAPTGDSVMVIGSLLVVVLVGLLCKGKSQKQMVGSIQDNSRPMPVMHGNVIAVPANSVQFRGAGISDSDL